MEGELIYDLHQKQILDVSCWLLEAAVSLPKLP
jgi:hypothetical protein